MSPGGEAPGSAGDLGFEVKSPDPDPDGPPVIYPVGVIRPDGPAANSGLKVGDIITSVNDHDVIGDNDYLCDGLTSVPVGSTMKLGLKRNAVVSVVAGTPL